MFERFRLHIESKMIRVQVVVHAVIPRAVKSRRRIRRTLTTVCAYPDPLAPWHLSVAPLLSRAQSFAPPEPHTSEHPESFENRLQGISLRPEY
jgi:hypothetical protein